MNHTSVFLINSVLSRNSAEYGMRNFSALYRVLVLWLAGLCAAAQFAKVGLFIPELQSLYPETESAIGFLITLISFAGAVLGLIAGMLVGRSGPRIILLTGMILGCLLSLAQSLILPLGMVLISRVLEGASHLAIVVAAPMLIAQHSSDRMRPAAMTLWGSFFGVSFMLTAWLGLPLVEAKGLQALLFAHAILTGITALLVWLVIPKTTLQLHTDTHTQPLSLTSIYQQHKNAWRSPFIAAPASGWLFYTITFVALLAILPGLMQSDQRAFVATTMPMASIASSMTIGIVLLLRFTAVQVLNIGFAISICIAVILMILPNSPVVCISLFAALGLVQGASVAAIPELNPIAAKQALAYGAFAQAGNIGNLCGTPLLLILFNFGGIKPMIMLVVVCYLLGILSHWIFSRQRALANQAISF